MARVPAQGHSKRLAAHLKRWEESGTKAGEFMVVREAEH